MAKTSRKNNLRIAGYVPHDLYNRFQKFKDENTYVSESEALRALIKKGLASQPFPLQGHPREEDNPDRIFDEANMQVSGY